ncbi:MAG: D-glycero-D-manno-heptose 1,7-bisphosphate phosphatase [Fusobacteriaceae bacterium]|jgi:D,D-heptose 1,7-bisphosphate phosphatase|nr:D-alpha,beta-D-heptose 1,7-bisphosphate phosphatase [Fusobacteriales bacterium]MDN5303862.1 D-glycero-D-manno-heptose 1,7-bisphosphate phosphatase [Fusobacteriaceae bacterium]
MKKCIFIDRDGTINVEKNYLHKIEDFEFIENSEKAIKIFKELGYLVIVITNQSGIARGYYNENDVKILHNHINEALKNNYNVEIDDFYYCPHHTKGNIKEYSIECKCRKPEPEMFIKAKEKYNIDFLNSYMVGDKLSDLEGAIKLGIEPIFVKTGHGKIEEEKIYFNVKKYNDIYEFAKELEKIK